MFKVGRKAKEGDSPLFPQLDTFARRPCDRTPASSFTPPFEIDAPFLPLPLTNRSSPRPSSLWTSRLCSARSYFLFLTTVRSLTMRRDNRLSPDYEAAAPYDLSSRRGNRTNRPWIAQRLPSGLEATSVDRSKGISVSFLR